MNIVTLLDKPALQRCLNSPYLDVDESKQAEVQTELAAARDFYQQAVRSFRENDEASGLKQAWGAMFRAARGLVYQAGYNVEQLRCMEVVLVQEYRDQMTGEEIRELRLAQELKGTPNVALQRAKQFIAKVNTLVR